MKLKQLVLSEEVEIGYVEEVLLAGYVQLKFDSIEIFNKSFGKFFNILWDFAEKIRSVEAPSSGSSIFEDTVKIISVLEDKLETTIDHVVLDAKNHEDIKQLVDFYYDDLADGSLTIGIKLSSNEDDYKTREIFKSPIEIISYIESNRLSGVTICISSHLCEHPQWTMPGHYRDSIMPYVSMEYHWGYPILFE